MVGCTCVVYFVDYVCFWSPRTIEVASFYRNLRCKPTSNRPLDVCVIMSALHAFDDEKKVLYVPGGLSFEPRLPGRSIDGHSKYL